jgi:NAD-dependent dihydropyrimidine dehydrogenase PreA subunit
VFSLGNLFRASERKVELSCIDCNKCVEICPFDAIKPDFTTRGTDCTLCQTCGGVCPTGSIKFAARWNTAARKAVNDPPAGATPLGRRRFLSLGAGSAAALVGGLGAALGTRAWGADASRLAVRPPGSVPEPLFLDLCIRCGACFQVCPNNVLQPMGFEGGLDGLWTPRVVADWAGCEASCNACGQLCPTGAIRAIPLEEKRVARMGLALVNQRTCLPLAGRDACQLCVEECNSAGYRAIEQMRVGTQVNQNGQPIEGSGFLAPVVVADKCVGCGLCQTRCYAVNVKTANLLDNSAIIVEAGEGREDRIGRGSYRELRRREAAQREEAQRKRREQSGDGGYYVPGMEEPGDPFGADPFAVEPRDGNPF